MPLQQTVLNLLAVSITAALALASAANDEKTGHLFEKRDQSQWSDLIGHRLPGMQHAENNIGKRQSGTYDTATLPSQQTTGPNGSFRILPSNDGSTLIKLFSHKEHNRGIPHDAEDTSGYAASYREGGYKRNGNLNDVIYGHYSKHIHPDDFGKRSTYSPDFGFAEWWNKFAKTENHA